MTPEPLPRPIRVLVADDHPMLREGIASLLEDEPDLELVAEAANGREAVDLWRSLRPDVTLMDIQMPVLDGIAATAEILALSERARIVMLTTYAGDVQARHALKAGAVGYLLKNMLRHDLATILRNVHAGRRHIPADVAQELAHHIADDELSAREVEVLRWVSLGSSNKRIAQQLQVTEDTIKSHMKTILAKLGANDRAHAVTLGLRRGILQL
jgi:DNA-binding NarL/FixJ family response regulator